MWAGHEPHSQAHVMLLLHTKSNEQGLGINEAIMYACVSFIQQCIVCVTLCFIMSTLCLCR